MKMLPWLMEGVNVTEHLPLASSAQLRAEKLPEPGGLIVKLTNPVGVTGRPPSVSATVAVHVVGTPRPSPVGVQDRLVVVLRDR